MSLQSRREFDAASKKLRLLEERCEAEKRVQGGDAHVRKLSMRSLNFTAQRRRNRLADVTQTHKGGPPSLSKFTSCAVELSD